MMRNLILDTDSYKASHYRCYPQGATGMFSYLESRGGRYDRTVFFGLQYLIREYLTERVTRHDVDGAKEFFKEHGEPFNRVGWSRIADLGYLPIRIRAVPEGSIVPTNNVLMTVESTDPETFWLVSWLETMLVRLWYPITVATRSWHIRKTILQYLEKTGDTAEIDFKLHDFGSRGVSSRESAGIGGMAHLVSFKGSDTVEGVRFANHYYKAGMAGFSIPAAEHSTITMWGRDREQIAYGHMIDEFGKPGALVACVSDSYDYWRALHLWTGPLLENVKRSGATLIIRPDSGDPTTTVLKTLIHFDQKIGCVVNAKGYKMLPPYFRIIQGDGVNDDSIADVLGAVARAGYSTSNVAFGMGGALLQQLDRDTQKFAYKCSSATIDGREVDVRKCPIDDPGKASRAGHLDLARIDNEYITGRINSDKAYVVPSAMRTVFEDGKILVEDDFATVRARALGGV